MFLEAEAARRGKIETRLLSNMFQVATTKLSVWYSGTTKSQVVQWFCIILGI